MKMFLLTAIGLFLAAVGSVHAASQLAPLYQALAKDPRSAEAINVDLFKAVPSEEIPVIVSALRSGNQVVMDAAPLGSDRRIPSPDTGPG
jgi:hypothetical protein